MAIKESSEMYLETIFILSKSRDTVRAIDVSEYMGFSKPSVSRALGVLKNEKLITVDSNGKIDLTANGIALATEMYERHIVLTHIFTSIGVDEQTAEKDACRIEHYISDTTFNALKTHLIDKR